MSHKTNCFLTTGYILKAFGVCIYEAFHAPLAISVARFGSLLNHIIPGNDFQTCEC